MQDIEALKKEAGIKACDYVQTGMKVGLGTGSTVKYTIIELARRMNEEGLEITGVPTSLATKELAESLGISLIELDQTNGLDIV
ncbi:MAG: ribose 5-phosphate isomerase A, partial [Candidatus Poseidoniaceae archaeon]